MKVELSGYEHADNGLSLQMHPETEVEVELLRSMWRHGRLETGHPCKAELGNTGFYIKAFYKPKEGAK